MSFRGQLDHALAQRGYVLDPSQQAAADRLQQLYDDCVDYKAQRSNALKKLLAHPPVPRGVYLWGGVGRGKSFLMDIFFTAVPITRKTRVHFHEFMRSVHRELDDLKGIEDPLYEVAKRIASRFRLICFDEFHISDIADAMILHRLLAKLFELNVGFVVTSNYPPDRLYPDGLHRDRVLPAIDLLKERLDVLAVDAGVDYRQRAMSRIDAYLTPSGPVADATLQAAFERIAEADDDDPVLKIEGRRIRARRRAGGVAWFDFAVLCGGPRSQNDYLEIAALFHTVLLSNIPRMSAGQASEARRFTWLVDVLYDRRVSLIASAEAPPEQLYVAGALTNEFARTASRLQEMQSREYLEAPRRSVGARVS
ncbi:MAG TPA: cell division protein ZapE [Burkholderiaceae bacterium]|nr:cell division protein ZapE [Burkholderiaceae bacterium]